VWNKKTSLPGWIVLYEELRSQLTSGRIKPEETLNLEKLKQQLRVLLSPEEERQAIDYLIAE
jgi:DNA-binding GntR family transcriptional regulator